MKFTPTRIPDVIVIEPTVFSDERGFFMETWRESEFNDAGISQQFVQDNHSRSSQGVLRGLHYQVKNPQGKLIRVVVGEIYDVAVDMRKDSASFGKWVSVVLSAENKKILWVPPGCAHGFYVISPYAEFVYKCTDYYAPEQERCIRWDDPDLAIDWPIQGSEPLLSEKDRTGAQFCDADYYE